VLVAVLFGLAASSALVIGSLVGAISGKERPEEREVVASGARGGVGLALLAAVSLDGRSTAISV
jgi:zinc transporter, ZIP family